MELRDLLSIGQTSCGGHFEGLWDTFDGSLDAQKYLFSLLALKGCAGVGFFAKVVDERYLLGAVRVAEDEVEGDERGEEGEASGPFRPFELLLLEFLLGFGFPSSDSDP